MAVADELMKLKPHDDLIAKEKIESGTISKQMGEMAFDKFMGCMACHFIEPEYGGFSGPELYTAAKRLQPEYIASYHPQSAGLGSKDMDAEQTCVGRQYPENGALPGVARQGEWK